MEERIEREHAYIDLWTVGRSDRHLLIELLKGQSNIMANIDALKAIAATLATDVATLIAGGIGTGATAADQADVDALTAELTTIDTDVQAAIAATTPTVVVVPAAAAATATSAAVDSTLGANSVPNA